MQYITEEIEQNGIAMFLTLRKTARKQKRSHMISPVLIWMSWISSE